MFLRRWLARTAVGSTAKGVHVLSDSCVFDGSICRRDHVCIQSRI